MPKKYKKFSYKISYKLKENVYPNNKIKQFQKKKWLILKKQFFKQKNVITEPLFERSKFKYRKNSFNTNLQKKTFESFENYSLKFYIYSQYKLKQKIKSFYGISERNLKSIFKKASKKYKNNSSHKKKKIYYILSLLEGRLDIFLFRLNFTKSVYESQQLISHKGVLINNKQVNIKNYILSPGDVVKIKPEKQKMVFLNIKTKIKKKLIETNKPYFEINYKTLTCIFLNTPQEKDLSYFIRVNLDNLSQLYR